MQDLRSTAKKNEALTSRSAHSNQFPLERLSADQIIKALKSEPEIQQAIQQEGGYSKRIWRAHIRAGKRAEERVAPLLEKAKDAGLIPSTTDLGTANYNLDQVEARSYKLVGVKTHYADTKCQDAACIYRDPKGRFIVAASSDGAGGMNLSHYGAELLSRFAAEVSSDLLEQGLKPETKEFLGKFYKGLYAKAHDVCRKVGVSPETAGNTFLAATTMLTTVEARPYGVHVSQISLSDGSIVNGSEWHRVDRLPKERFPVEIREATTEDYNYGNMIATALSTDLGGKIPLYDHVKGIGEERIKKLVETSHSAILIEQKIGGQCLYDGVGNASDGIRHTKAGNFPLKELVRSGVKREELQKLACVYNLAVTLEHSTTARADILLARLGVLEELAEGHGEQTEIAKLTKIAGQFLSATLGSFLHEIGEDHSHVYGISLAESIGLAKATLKELKMQSHSEDPSVIASATKQIDRLVEHLGPYEKQLGKAAKELLTDSQYFAGIDFTKAAAIWDDVVVVYMTSPVPELAVSKLPKLSEHEEASRANLTISERINNFVNFLPGGYQRVPGFVGVLAEPDRLHVKLRDELSGREGAGNSYSEKRLAQTGAEFLAEIDSACEALGLELKTVAEATRQYRTLQGKGESSSFLKEIAEPVFDELLTRGYLPIDLRT